MQCSVLLYSLLYKYCCTAVWRPPPPQCSYCSRHRLSGRRSYLHPQFTAQLVGACSYWHLGTEHVFFWPCAYYYYFLRLKFLTTKFLTGDAVCRPIKRQSRLWSQRGTKVNGSHHGDNPLLRPTGIQIATKSYAALQAMAPTNIKTVHQTSLLHSRATSIDSECLYLCRSCDGTKYLILYPVYNSKYIR